MKWSRRSHQSAWTPQGGLEVDGGALRGTRRSKETATSPVKLIFFSFFQDNLTSALLNENGPNLNLSRRGLAR